VDSKVSYVCERVNETIREGGHDVRFCLASGEWTGRLPECGQDTTTTMAATTTTTTMTTKMTATANSTNSEEDVVVDKPVRPRSGHGRHEEEEEESDAGRADLSSVFVPLVMALCASVR